MKNSGEKILKQRILKWLINATLFFSLFVFGGNISTSQPYSSKPTQTELTNTNSSNSKRTVCFNQLNHNTNTFLQSFRPSSFDNFILAYDREINIKFKRNALASRPKKKQVKQSLIYYPNESTDMSSSHNTRG